MSSSTWAIIINPQSGGGKTKKQWAKINAELKTMNVDHNLHWSESSGHAVEIAQQCRAQGYTKFFAIGGDGTIQEVVNGALAQGYSNDSDLITLVGLQRSYLSLVTVLFGNLSKRGSVVSELARRTLRGFSQWYPKLPRDPTFLICLQTVIANTSSEKISFSSCNFWSDKFSQVVDNPTSLYLTMRDKLSNLSNEDGLPFEQNAMIQQIISQTTRDIIGANKKPPSNKQAESLAKDALVDGFQLEIGHKAQVVLSTVKLIFMYEFLLGGESQ